LAILEFPPIETADETGLLAAGGDLEVSSLLLAYSSGIFPWPQDEELPLWFAPPRRALLFFKDYHASRSLKKTLRRPGWSFSINKRFTDVITACARGDMRKEQNGTWITPSMISAYVDFHKAGFCHSIECYYEGELAGGIYGVSIGKMFAAESMFYNRPNGSRLSLHYLVEYLQKQDVEWLDCQIINPFLQSFGTTEIPRDQYMELLSKSVSKKVSLFPPI